MGKKNAVVADVAVAEKEWNDMTESEKDKAALEAGQEVLAQIGMKKTKRGRFLEIAPKRTEKAAQAMRNLARCGLRTSYEYTEDEVAQILDYLAREYADVKRAFEGVKVKADGFEFFNER
jgi:hypothetical protein